MDRDLSGQITELKNLRHAAGLTQQQLSAELGIPRRTLEDWESGRRKMPDYVLRLMGYWAEMNRLKSTPPE